MDCLGETPPLEPDNATVARKQSSSRHRVASVSQEILEEVAKPRWTARLVGDFWIRPRQCSPRNEDTGGTDDSGENKSASPTPQRSDPAKEKRQ